MIVIVIVMAEMELSQAVLLNQQRIIALCRRADKAHRGVVPAAAFFRIMAKLGMALNQALLCARCVSGSPRCNGQYIDGLECRWSARWWPPSSWDEATWGFAMRTSFGHLCRDRA